MAGRERWLTRGAVSVQEGASEQVLESNLLKQAREIVCVIVWHSVYETR